MYNPFYIKKPETRDETRKILIDYFFAAMTSIFLVTFYLSNLNLSMRANILIILAFFAFQSIFRSFIKK